jgi:hypothetical protein
LRSLISQSLNSKPIIIIVPFLPIREDLHPKRNQGRQKLATLPNSRFKDMACDLILEIERRYPHIMDEYVARYGDDVS